MTDDDERPVDPEAEDVQPSPGDEELASSDPDEERPDVQPVPDKIGEGGTNLRDREAALKRRQGGDEPSQ